MEKNKYMHMEPNTKMVAAVLCVTAKTYTHVYNYVYICVREW